MEWVDDSFDQSVVVFVGLKAVDGKKWRCLCEFILVFFGLAP